MSGSPELGLIQFVYKDDEGTFREYSRVIDFTSAKGSLHFYLDDFLYAKQSVKEKQYLPKRGKGLWPI